jgi:hypothetical protein
MTRDGLLLRIVDCLVCALFGAALWALLTLFEPKCSQANVHCLRKCLPIRSIARSVAAPLW